MLPFTSFASHLPQGVRDLDWEPEGRFLLTVSDDQTARIFAPWHAPDEGHATWHEIARPQVHGYDMRCVCMAGKDGMRYVSGADEKVVRTFTAPASFARTFARVVLGDASSANAGEAPRRPWCSQSVAVPECGRVGTRHASHLLNV